MSEKYIYFFGDGKAEGNGQMKDVLGGKGAGLAEMTNLGVNVPPGFTISTRIENMSAKNFNDTIRARLLAAKNEKRPDGLKYN